MTQNPHLGSDALAFLKSVIEDTPENRLVERQEIFRIALTQAMREVRKRKGLTQKQLASKLKVGQSWVSKLESANNDHTFESVIAYLTALEADFEAIILLEEQKIKVAAAKIEMTTEEAYTTFEPVWETCKSTENPDSPEFSLIPPEKQSKCSQAQNITASVGLWG